MISIVIPTLDAAANLGATLASLRPGRDLIREIIVSDGGSRDATCDLARREDCRVVTGERGRGGQLARGAEAARGDWLLFLHADARPAAEWPDAVRSFAARPDAGQHAAVFAFALDDPGVQARILERIVAARVRSLGLPYGDQGLLVSRLLYRELGGFRSLPLMEDVDFVRRIGGSRIVVLPVAAVTSAARYRSSGYAVRVARNAVCLGLYFAGLSPRLIARLYG